ncbi:MAG: crossover junction endodeoxyribonuclease RuvC [Gammaproteobacteria bacterium]|nr:crossover junction endodeoxyribonuclease RuvC [Gammaproteobacteria bacterium]
MSLILGIDPGSRVTGFGIIDSVGSTHRYVASGALRLKKDGSYSELHQIFSDLEKVIADYRPTDAAIEQVFMHANVNSALKLGQARGAAIVAMAKNHLRIAEYSSRQIKLAVVGFGAAEKPQVQQMVKMLLKLNALPQADEADALAVALCHAQTRRSMSVIKRGVVQ